MSTAGRYVSLPANSRAIQKFNDDSLLSPKPMLEKTVMHPDDNKTRTKSDTSDKPFEVGGGALSNSTHKPSPENALRDDTNGPAASSEEVVDAPSTSSDRKGKKDTSKGLDAVKKLLGAPQPQKNQAQGTTLATVVKMHQWKVKSKKKRKQTIKSFSRSAAHLAFIKSHHDDVTTQLPLPMQSLIVDETVLIVQSTLKDYKASLGNQHELTRGADAYLEKLAKVQTRLQCM